MELKQDNDGSEMRLSSFCSSSIPTVKERETAAVVGNRICTARHSDDYVRGKQQRTWLQVHVTGFRTGSWLAVFVFTVLSEIVNFH